MKEMSRGEFDKLTDKYIAKDEDPDNLGVVPFDEWPEEAKNKDFEEETEI